MFPGCLIIESLRSLVKARAFAHVVARRLLSLISWYMTVSIVVSVGHIGMYRTSCSGETRSARTKLIRSQKASIIMM